MEMKMQMTLEQELAIWWSIKSVLAPTAPIVSICGWCPDKDERTRALVAEGKAVSHGMCPVCAEKMNRQMEML